MTQELDDLLNKGTTAYSRGDTALAAQIYRKAREIAPDNPTVRLRLALSMWHGENRADEALAEIADLKKTYPQAGIFASEALILNSLGRFDAAAEAARSAVKADPLHSAAWRDLATAVDPDGAPGVVGQIGALLNRQDLTAEQLRDMHYAAATALAKMGETVRAFTHTECGNGLARNGWNADTERTRLDHMRAVFLPEVLARVDGETSAEQNEGDDDKRMIFIVGMPRSGTTLLERLLVAHPDVGSAGETPMIGRLFAQFEKQAGAEPRDQRPSLTGQALTGAAGAYIEAMKLRLGGTLPPRLIDKMPANYIFVPFIAMIFPKAQILHIQRHPLDTCLSCLRASFGFGLDYAHNQSTMGLAYRQYESLMDDWTALLGDRVHGIVYEDLVSNPEQVMRRTLDHCGLGWDPACAVPAEGGIIKTASNVQARGPVSTGSVGAWKELEARLQPLIQTLGGMDWIERHWSSVHPQAESDAGTQAETPE